MVEHAIARPVAIVTGGSGTGIGRSIALTLARDGYDIALTYRTNGMAAADTVAAIGRLGGRAIALQSDLFDPLATAALVPEVVAKLGSLRAVIIGPGAGWHPAAPTELAPADAISDVTAETLPVFAIVPAAIKAMRETGGGHLVALASNQRHPSPAYAYNTAKQARIAAMLNLVDTCWKHRITVNVVAPGPVEPITASEAMAQVEALPTGATLSPQDIAEAVSFLCSPRARFLTGNVIEAAF